MGVGAALIDLLLVSIPKYWTFFTMSGIFIPLVIVIAIMWFRKDDSYKVWFARPKSWLKTITLGFGAAALLLLVSALMWQTTPLLGLGTADYSRFADYVGNTPKYLFALPMIWLIPALMEEIIDRSFLIDRLTVVMGDGTAARIGIIVIVSAAFALAHPYQGAVGMLTIFVPALIYPVLYYMNGRNLWANIIAHGLFDTAFLTLVYWGVVATG